MDDWLKILIFDSNVRDMLEWRLKDFPDTI